MDKLWTVIAPYLTFWILFGFAGHFIFAGAFVIQWLASERRKRSHVPVSFWWLRILGSAMLLTLTINMLANGNEKAIPLVFGFSLNIFIYVRNLMLIHRRRAVAVPAGPEEDD